MLGTIATIAQSAQSGTILGDDKKTRPFRRAGMVEWGVFLELRPGDRVQFDVEAGRAINVERAPALLLEQERNDPPKRTRR